MARGNAPAVPTADRRAGSNGAATLLGRILVVPFRAVDRAAEGFGFISGVGFLAMALIVTYSVAVRYILNAPVSFAEELSGYLLVMGGFLGGAYAAREAAHVKVPLLIDRVPRAAQWLLRSVSYLAGSAYLAVVAWACWGLVGYSYQSGRAAASPLATPLYLPQILLALGVTLALGYHLLRPVRAFLHDRKEN